jgi:hypothetical protein
MSTSVKTKVGMLMAIPIYLSLASIFIVGYITFWLIVVTLKMTGTLNALEFLFKLTKEKLVESELKNVLSKDDFSLLKNEKPKTNSNNN